VSVTRVCTISAEVVVHGQPSCPSPVHTSAGHAVSLHSLKHWHAVCCLSKNTL